MSRRTAPARGRCDLLLRQGAYASASITAAANSLTAALEFNLALPRAYDLSQLAPFRHPLNSLSCS
jgi:hypothetical protein